ncbi:MAG: type IV secretory system conjugative DNA transfer family protein [Firmicutes bacterium]|nr:type IV secretory system conjugative DNA transfer family protein [[Eubacterium] siraeum]MCM1486769.1 type IV secretory system conjugative DNA transfer family protein [Bacillota bacterium]
MRADNRILGEGVVYSTDCKKTGLNNNIIVSGTSGCGKTMSVAEPLLLNTYSTNLVVTVTKRRLVDKYAPMFKERCYRVLDLNFVNPKQSNVSFDPLRYVKGFSDITFLAKAIVSSNPRKEHSNADPYWEESAISMLSAEIALAMMVEGKKATLANVLDMHENLTFKESDELISTSLDDWFEEYADHKLGKFAINNWKTFKQLPLRTASCIFGTLNTALSAIFSPELKEMIRSSANINFEKLASEKTILFVSTSAVNPALNCFVNMFYSQLFKSLFEFGEKQPDGRLPIPVHVLCDDFATGSRIMNFPEYISIFREKDISVTLLIQSESQLQGMYGCDNATTIINNCDTYLYMGGMDLTTGRSISARMNIPLDEVLYMPIGQLFIFRRGQKPIVTTRYNVEENATYQKVTRRYEASISRCGSLREAS